MDGHVQQRTATDESCTPNVHAMDQPTVEPRTTQRNVARPGSKSATPNGHRPRATAVAPPRRKVLGARHTSLSAKAGSIPQPPRRGVSATAALETATDQMLRRREARRGIPPRPGGLCRTPPSSPKCAGWWASPRRPPLVVGAVRDTCGQTVSPLGVGDDRVCSHRVEVPTKRPVDSDAGRICAYSTVHTGVSCIHCIEHNARN